MIPNLLHVVERVKAENPVAWANAHTGNAQTEDFIRILAAECYEIDTRFGLNGKRGDPKDISDDAINYIGEGPGHDPTHGNAPVTVFDVIRGAGGPNPQPSWDKIDQPGPGAWVQPGTSVPPPSTLPPYPGDPVFDEIGVALFADYAQAGQAPNPGMGRWFGRTTYDYLAGMSMDDSIDKHRAEWRAVLGLPPL